LTKVSRTFRIDKKLSDALDAIHKRNGDYTFHLESALALYSPIKAVLDGKQVKAKAKC
jgi:hypothetical protein